MVKIYYQYKFEKPIDQIISKHCNFVYDHIRRIFITGINQYVGIISAKTGEVLSYLQKKGKNVPIRVVYYHKGKIYGGFEDGEIVVWEMKNQLLSSMNKNNEEADQDLELTKQIASFDLHEATVSSICVTDHDNKLVSGGMDGNILIWDLLSEQSHQIKSAHPSAITQIDVMSIVCGGKPITIILSIGKDGFLRVWNLQNQLCLAAVCLEVTEAYSMYVDKGRKIAYVGTNKEDIVEVEFYENEESGNKICGIRGIFKKKSYGRCLQIAVFDEYIHFVSSDKMIETYKILNKNELEQRKKKVLSRKKKQNETVNPDEIEMPSDAQLQLKEVSQKILPFKFYSVCIAPNPLPTMYINNGTNIYDLTSEKQITYGSGRTLQLQYDHPFVIQRTKTDLRVFNTNLLKMNKLYTLEKETLNGELQEKFIQQLTDGESQKLPHNNEIKACSLFNKSFLMVVMSHCLCLWDLSKNECVFALKGSFDGCYIKNNKCLAWSENMLYVYGIGYNKRKSIVMRLQSEKGFDEKITSCMYKHTNLQKYLVSLENNQIYIQYADTHKNFLKLYGHKLPILSFDISDDDSIIATGSADKDIKLWDMDFGHCIKSIFAHQEPITCVKFIKQTHYLLSGSKDGHLKFWDADTYQLIIDLQENLLQIRALVVSNAGDFILAGGLDEGLRLWKQTSDQTIATDMEEKQLEKIMIQDYTKDKLKQSDKDQKTRYEDLKHGQQIIEALENSESPKLVINLLKRIPPSNLKSCLSFLHGRHINRLEQYLELCVKKRYEPQLCCRVIQQLNRGSELSKILRSSMKSIYQTVGMNNEGLKILLSAIKDESAL